MRAGRSNNPATGKSSAAAKGNKRKWDLMVADETSEEYQKGLQVFKDKFANVTFTDEQNNAIQAFSAGRNIMLSGVGGVGKSMTTQYLIGLSRYEHKVPTLPMGSTGCAANIIGGVTFNCGVGFGLLNKSVRFYTNKIDKGEFKHQVEEWTKVKRAFIDEISMLHPIAFYKADRIIRHIRGKINPEYAKLPFGGVQLVCIGDWGQLPPVHKTPRGHRPRIDDGYCEFVFELDLWKEFDFVNVQLTEVHRQKDEHMVRMLNCVRMGIITSEVEDFFKSCANTVFPDDGIEPTILYAKNKPVIEENQRRINSLPGKPYTYSSKNGYTVEPEFRSDHSIMRKFSDLMLKDKAQVLLIRNIRGTDYFNGMRGVIVGFDEDPAEKEMQQAYERECKRLKSVAEKKKESEGESKSDEKEESASGDSEKNEKKELALPPPPKKSGMLYPKVKWEDGTTSVVLLERWEVEEEEIGYAYHEQIPLVLGYAQSMHSVQGAQMSRVIVNFDGIFAPGQAYIALSRVTSKEGLRVIGFHVKYITVHPKVREYYRLGMVWPYPLDVHTCNHFDPDPLGEQDEKRIEGILKQKTAAFVDSRATGRPPSTGTWKREDHFQKRSTQFLNHFKTNVMAPPETASAVAGGPGGRGRPQWKKRSFE